MLGSGDVRQTIDVAVAPSSRMHGYSPTKTMFSSMVVLKPRPWKYNLVPPKRLPSKELVVAGFCKVTEVTLKEYDRLSRRAVSSNNLNFGMNIAERIRIKIISN